MGWDICSCSEGGAYLVKSEHEPAGQLMQQQRREQLGVRAWFDSNREREGERKQVSFKNRDGVESNQECSN